jgi:hypothetical protein
MNVEDLECFVQNLIERVDTLETSESGSGSEGLTVEDVENKL